MKRLVLSLALAAIAVFATCAQAVRINVDYKTVAAMAAAYGAEHASEQYYGEQVGRILERYSAAEVASAAIFASKHLDRIAMTNIGIWGDGTENYYYRRIKVLVASKIMPKIVAVAAQMLHSPQTALYWGSYLMKICGETKELCAQFESVVTNSKLTFSDVAFLCMSPDVARLLDLAKLGDIDWDRMLDDFAEATSHFTMESLTADLDRLCGMAADIVSSDIANAASALYDKSEFSSLMNGNLLALLDIIDRYDAIYDSFRASVGQAIISLVGGTGNVLRLFDLASYDITSWMLDYLETDASAYYTQVWSICCDSYSDELETLVDYEPLTTEYLKIGHIGSLNGDDELRIRRNSESHAGWSEERVRGMNASQGPRYYIEYPEMRYYQYSYSWNPDGPLMAYAYCIKVTRTKTSKTAVWEDVFDSYSMDRSTFMELANLKLRELNANEDDITYYLEGSPKNYYTVADEAKLNGCESVIVSAACHDSAELGKGTSQFKCRECDGTLNAHSRQCAMRTNAKESSLDSSELDAMESETLRMMEEINARITELEEENARLTRQIGRVTIDESASLRQKYFDNKEEISKLRTRLTELEESLKEIQAAKGEIGADDEVQTDDLHRIPYIMSELQAKYNLTWSSSGQWNGFTFIRTATASGLRGSITFEATLSIARKPKRFLGILIHRCITQIDWKLTGEFSDSQIVDIIELEASSDEEEKAKEVNQRISQAAQDFPGCDITTEYISTEPMEDTGNDDVYHLLWASDRLEVAMQVESRLSHIYSDLVCLEKMMNYKLTIIDALKKASPRISDTVGRGNLVYERYRLWKENLKGARHE